MITDPDLEQRLRAVLKAEEPPRDLLPGVMTRLASPPRRRGWMPALALAAAVLLTGLIGFRIHQQDLAEQQQARADAQQVTRALRVAATDLVRIQRQIQRTD